MNEPAKSRTEVNGISADHDREAILENLQTAFNISREELEEMMKDDHFNHQY